MSDIISQWLSDLKKKASEKIDIVKPWMESVEKSEAVQKMGFLEIHSATITHSATVELFSKTVPANLRLFLQKFSNYADNADAWGYLTWVVKADGKAVYPFHAIVDQYGDLSLPFEMPEGVEIPPGAVLSVEVTNSHTATDYTAGVCVRGEYR